MSFRSLLPLSYALFAAFLGLLFLTKRKRVPTYALGTAAALQSGMAFLFFIFLRVFPSEIAFIYLKAALVLAALSPIPIALFSFTHVRGESRPFPMFPRIALPTLSLLGILFAATAFHPDFLQGLTLSSDTWMIYFGPLGTAFGVYLVLAFLTILYEMEEAFRTSRRYLRRRLKFLLLGITTASLYTLIMASILLLYQTVHLDLLLGGVLVYAISWVMVAFAVFQHRLLEVDIFVSRHVVFAAVMSFSAGLYLLGLGLLGYALQKAGRPWNLFWQVSFVSVGLILLAILLSSSTWQRRIKHFINVHFYRYKYDYRIEWSDFTQRLNEVQDLPNLLSKLIETVTETLWVHEISIWLYNEKSGILTSRQTLNLPRKAGFLNRESPLVQYLEKSAVPLNMSHPEAEKITSAHRDLLNLLKASVVVPLKKGARLVGMMTLGAPMRGTAFVDEDYELLQTIAQQASSAIFSAELIEEVAATKEAESFHKISSFLVHDLKNLVSSLSLVLQNAGRNISKPDFQKDLLSTLVNTIEKMKILIEKLSTLPKELDIRKTPIDINQHVMEALESSKVQALKGVDVSTDLAPLPPVEADGEYSKKVLTNLILNAVQSLPGGRGKIELATYAKDGYVHVEVLDSGMGMTEDFIQKKLFKPFTSTKKKGLGIGLYQSKAIMEAHGGTIEASSVPRRGSQFVLKFPVKK